MTRGKGPPLPVELSKRQQETLTVIKSYIQEHGFPPTVKELGKMLRLSVATVHQHLDYLQRKGYITRKGGSLARNIRVLMEEQHETFRKIPVIGRITAGLPILAVEHHEGYLSVDPYRYKGDDLFALIVHGDSMTGDGIMDGDCVIVRPQPVVDNGEIGVVLIGDEATIKHVYFDETSITIKPSNPKYEERILTDEEVLIQGKVIGVQRFFETS